MGVRALRDSRLRVGARAVTLERAGGEGGFEPAPDLLKAISRKSTATVGYAHPLVFPQFAHL